MIIGKDPFVLSENRSAFLACGSHDDLIRSLGDPTLGIVRYRQFAMLKEFRKFPRGGR